MENKKRMAAQIECSFLESQKSHQRAEKLVEEQKKIAASCMEAARKADGSSASCWTKLKLCINKFSQFCSMPLDPAEVN